MMYVIFWMFFGVGLAYWLGYQSARSSSDQNNLPENPCIGLEEVNGHRVTKRLEDIKVKH